MTAKGGRAKSRFHAATQRSQRRAGDKEQVLEIVGAASCREGRKGEEQVSRPGTICRSYPGTIYWSYGASGAGAVGKGVIHHGDTEEDKFKGKGGLFFLENRKTPIL
jgi:hypothetical protein